MQFRPRSAGISFVASLGIVASACGAAETASPGTDAPPVTSPVTSPVNSPNTSPETAMADAVRAARERWESSGVDSYEWETMTSCFCPEIDPVTTRVLGGRVIGAPDDVFLVTVEDLFDSIEADLAGGGTVDATFHPELGYPTHVASDPLPEAIDDEYSVTVVTALTVVADPIARWFTEAHPCGYGFQVGTPDQHAGLFVTVDDGGSLPASPETYAIADDVTTVGIELRVGSDLFANWCDDVIEPGEPTPAIDERWTATSGRLAVRSESDTIAIGELTGIAVRTLDGRDVPLGDAVVRNELWGGAAG